MKISMLSTGEEVLHGDIVDSNASWLGEQFFQHGFGLDYRATVGDQLDGLVAEITALSLRSDVVIVNGGLGPTSDDMSAQAMAQAAGVELELKQEWLENIEGYFASLGRPMAPSNVKQAMLPIGSEIIDNPVGTACGFSMRLNDALIMFTPGVPFEFKRMVTDEILPLLHQLYPSVEQQACHKIYVLGLGESSIADSLKSLTLPQGFSLGYRSYLPFIEVKVFCPVRHPELNEIVQQIADILIDNVVGIDKPLTNGVVDALQSQQWQLSILEQVTGGELARQMYRAGPTGPDDAQSSVFQQSIVDNQAPKLAELADSVLLCAEYRQDTQADVSLANFWLEDGSIALTLSTEQGAWAQQVTFKRDYPLIAKQVIVTMVLLDMLRRQASDLKVIGQYGYFECVNKIEI
ncbi:CinA family nicotinamide mononucleotide deamidase-related protein [Vibrio sp. S11_S32]|uniref:CinA family nicotinamide mononucleotide deamidase-related protein n=1 Tax=Vibrio sp. S11_S32 TaxID=2720225 RepID=UPI0016816E61|nr:CinA family nicotinamide mononucleotide deamidase-related protein [Vibrio sp. S11_S32]MBD1577591.1 CinA family nicotinamide mononucleotide deamidase-related protein [Vibrio sp. S11_S32]